MNVNTFLCSLSGLSATIDEVTTEVGEGQKLKITIKALEKGSFLIDLDLMVTPVLDIGKAVDFNVISKVTRTVVDIFTPRKFLRGEKPQQVQEKGDNVTVTSK